MVSEQYHIFLTLLRCKTLELLTVLTENNSCFSVFRATFLLIFDIDFVNID